jgi:hypothetical protein
MITNILAATSIIVSFVTALLVVILNKKNDRALKRIEHNLKKEDLFLNRLISLRDNLANPVGALQGDLQALSSILENNDEKKLAQFFTPEFVDRNAERIGEASIEFERNKFLFNKDEILGLETLRGRYQDLALQDDVAGAFTEAANFHNYFLELIDHKICSL